MNKLFFGNATLTHLGLLILRLGFGGFMAFAHGWPKLATFSEGAAGFNSMLGIGGEIEYALLVFAEFFCAIFVAVGLFTRLSAFPLMFAMVIAAFVAHGADPFSAKEASLTYLVAYTTIFLTGPGRYSIDAAISPRGGAVYG